MPRRTIFPREACRYVLDSLRDRTRSGLFKRFFLPLLETYEGILSENGTIDFEDMILRPTRYLDEAERGETASGAVQVCTCG